MNKLLSNSNGGFPFVLDDLRFMDESVREVLKAQFERFIDANDPTDKGFLITNQISLKLTGTDIPIGGNAGNQMNNCFVYISGEIYFLPAGTIPAGTSPSNPCFVEPDISFTGTTPGQKVFENGSTVETYQIRRAKYTLTTTQPDFIQITSSTPLNGQNVANGYDFEFLTLCNLRQREYQNSTLNATNLTLNNLSTAFNQLSFNFSDVSNAVIGLLSDNWIDVPMSTLMRTSNPVFYFSKNTSPEMIPNVFTPVPLVSSINQSKSFLRIKRIGRTVFVTLNIEKLILPTYASQQIGGVFIDLNNLGIPGFTGGTVQNFVGNLQASERNLLSPISNVANVVKANNFQTTGKNGIFMRMFAGFQYSGGAWNLNYYFPVQSSSLGTVAGTQSQGDTSQNTVVAEWYLSGTLIFEMY